MNLSWTQICNLGLKRAGAGLIGNLDDSGERSPEAEFCRLEWPIVLSYVLESHPWKCCAKQASLATTTTAPLFGFDYAYPLPADYVRMIGMADQDATYQALGRVLHTDESPAEIDYVYLCVDPTKYTAGLVDTLAFQLAYRAALSLRQDARLAEQILGDLERFFLPIVRHADGASRGVRTTSRNVLTDLFEL
jgi:hypothetical protein